MRDQHRGKNELIDEVTGLRKQVADLKQAQVERRRIEDGLRRSEEQLRALLDAAPVGVCLLNQAGEPLLANVRMAELLGYASPQELVRLGSTLGLIGDDAGRSWLKARAEEAASGQTEMMFRRRDGTLVALPALGEKQEPGCDVAVVVLNRIVAPANQ
jgi:PAS domain S-box-containing protein